MGACGCSDGFGHYKFRGNGGWYVLTLYPGCEECDTPAGVVITWYADDSDISDCIDDVKDVTDVLYTRGRTADGLYLPTLDFYDFAKQVDANMGGTAGGEYETVADVAHDMHYPLRLACVDTINRTLSREPEEE